MGVIYHQSSQDTRPRDIHTSSFLEISSRREIMESARARERENERGLNRGKDERKKEESMEVRRVWGTLKPKSRFISTDYNIPRCFLSLSLLFSHFSRIYYLADIIFLLQDRSSSSSSSFSFFSLKLIASSTSTHGSLRGILRYWPLKDMSLHSFLICLEKLQRGLKNRAPYEFRRDEISRFQFTRVCIVIRVYDFQRVLHTRVCNYAFCNPIRFLKTCTIQEYLW